jgi:hypothetical protein
MAFAASKKLLKELPSEREMYSIIAQLKTYGDASTAVLGAAYIEHALESLLKAHFRPLRPEDERRMFDGASQGILGTFTAKIRLAYALQIIPQEMHDDLMLISTIRNAFAHSLHNVTFKDPFIAVDCRQLSVARAANPPSTTRPVDMFSTTVLVHYLYLRERVERRLLENARREQQAEAATSEPAP